MRHSSQLTMSILSGLRDTWQHDLRLRITVTLSLLLGSILVIAAALRLEEIKSSLEKSAQTRSQAIGRIVTVLGSVGLTENLHRIQNALTSYQNDPDISRVDVLNRDRLIVASTDQRRVGHALNNRHIASAQRLRNEVIEYDTPFEKTRSLVSIEPLWENGQITGWIFIEFSLANLRRDMFRATGESLLIALILIGTSVLIAQVSIRRISILLRDSATRLHIALTSLHQQFPALESDIDQPIAHPSHTIRPDHGEIEQTVELISHTIQLLTVQTHSIQTFTSSLEEAVASRTSQLNQTVEDLKQETAERALTEHALRDNETKYRTLFESSRDAIMLLSPPNWKFSACNPATLVLFGADSVEHFTTLGPWDVSPLLQPDGDPSANKAAAMIQYAMENGSCFFDWTHRRVNGPEFAATVLLTRITLNGQAGLQATVRDVTEQRRAEQALLDLSAFQKAILDNAGHAIISTTPDGIIRVFNPAAEALLGYAANEIIGRQTPALFHDPEEVASRARSFSAELGVRLEPSFDVFTEKCRRGLPNEHEWTYIRKDGTRLTVLLNVTALRTPDGHIGAFLGVASDITPLKVIQRELTLAKETAETASSAKSQFLANMSHEIRTPMNGVLGMAELLLATQLTERQHHMVDTIHRSGTALLGIINDILDVSKIEAGKLLLEHIAFDLRQTIEHVIEFFSEPAQKKGLALTCFIPTETPTIAIGDPVRLRQVLLNLVGNAVKFTERGEVSVRLHCLGQEPGRVRIQCDVTDTGIGVTKEAQQRLFTPFSQADGSTTRKFGGTGLGLTIVKQLVQLMGGTVGIESTPDVGSTFWFTATLDVQSHETAASAAEFPQSTPFFHSAKILLAEDNPVNREIALAMLEILGCLVDLAENGQDAITAATHSSYDLILMDCQMPVMDGFAATAAIRRHEDSAGTGRRLPIIALTANAMEGDREKCLSVGMDDYLSKPFSQDSLRATLQRWMTPKPPDDSPSPEEPAGTIAQTTPQGIPVLDESVLENLESAGRPNAVQNILVRYLSDSRRLLSKIRDAIHTGHAPVVRAAAHQLKSASAQVGALAASMHAGHIERLAGEQQLDAAAGLVGLLEESVASACRIFEDKIRPQAA